MSHEDLCRLSDRELLTEVKSAAAGERQSTAALMAVLAEVDARKLFLGEGCSSLFVYCTQVLHLSEHAAYGRIAAARASRRFPEILELLTSGDVTLTTIVLLAPHLTSENREALLAGASHKSKADVERLVACLHPQPDIESRIRRIPMSRPTASADSAQLEVLSPVPASDAPIPSPRAPVAATRPTVAPLAPERYLIKIAVSRVAHGHLRRAQDLLRHVVPTGDPAAIVERALAVLVDQLERRRLARVKRPGAARVSDETSRHVPASVRRAVWNRDGGRCAFVGAEGRCTETGFLEFHHIDPLRRRRTDDGEELVAAVPGAQRPRGDALFGRTRSRPS